MLRLKLFRAMPAMPILTGSLSALGDPHPFEVSRNQRRAFCNCGALLVPMSIGAVVGVGIFLPWKGKVAAIYPAVSKTFQQALGAIGNLPRKIDCTEPWLNLEQMIGWGAKDLPVAILVAARWAQTQRDQVTKNDLLAMLERTRS